MKIANFDTAKSVLIIAEIGNNHEGSLSLAKKLIDLAKVCGANAVKFQTLKPGELVCSTDKKRILQLKKFQLSYEKFKQLTVYAKKSGMIFLSTPFGIQSATFLAALVPAFKIASGDNNFYPLLKVVAKTGRPILLSAGLTDCNELRETVKFIEVCWKKNRVRGDLAILHCVCSYPVSVKDANLLSIKYLCDKFNYTVGYSDHCLGIEACVLAVALGARIIEKHFTIDKKYSNFRDHQLSADPKEMKEMVERIRSAEILLGKYKKSPSKSELEIKNLIRRSVAARHNLPSGHLIQGNDITWVRPGTGIPIGKENMVVGKQLKKAVAEGELITVVNLRS